HLGGFNDNVRDAFVGSQFDKNKRAFVQDGSGIETVKHGIEGNWRDWAPTPAQAINFLSCHDNLVIWDKLKVSKLAATEAELKQIAAWLRFHDTNIPGTVMFTLDPGSLPGETWKHVCVIANSADAINSDFALPAGRWRVALDASGAVKDERIVEGTVNVRYKSG